MVLAMQSLSQPRVINFRYEEALPAAMSPRCESEEQYHMCTCAQEWKSGLSKASIEVIPADCITLSGMPSTCSVADVLSGSMAVDIRYGVSLRLVWHEPLSQHHAPPRKRITNLHAQPTLGTTMYAYITWQSVVLPKAGLILKHPASGSPGYS